MHRTFHIFKTPTMNQVLLWSTEPSPLSVGQKNIEIKNEQVDNGPRVFKFIAVISK